KIDLSDSPSVAFLTRFSGNPLRHEDDSENPLGRLYRTEGEYRFVSFLAAVSKSFRTIITLGRCQWTATFDGDYDFDQNIWTPATPEIIDLQLANEGAIYPNISAESSVPFSLSLDQACDAMEIQMPNGWVTCFRCLPNSNKGYQPSGKRWGA